MTAWFKLYYALCDQGNMAKACDLAFDIAGRIHGLYGAKGMKRVLNEIDVNRLSASGIYFLLSSMRDVRHTHAYTVFAAKAQARLLALKESPERIDRLVGVWGV